MDREMETTGKALETRKLRIIAPRCTSTEELHAYIGRKLGFPAYYGGNLAALADCLSEICEPTEICICMDEAEIEPGMQAYLIRFVQVCAREAFANDNLCLAIEHHAHSGLADRSPEHS